MFTNIPMFLFYRKHHIKKLVVLGPMSIGHVFRALGVKQSLLAVLVN